MGDFEDDEIVDIEIKDPIEIVAKRTCDGGSCKHSVSDESYNAMRSAIFDALSNAIIQLNAGIKSNKGYSSSFSNCQTGSGGTSGFSSSALGTGGGSTFWGSVSNDIYNNSTAIGVGIGVGVGILAVGAGIAMWPAIAASPAIAAIGASLAAMGSSISRIGRNLRNWGPTFEQYKAAYWSKNIKPIYNSIIMRNGKAFRVFEELHHKYFPQRWNWVPNWLKNNRFNLRPMNTIEHGIKDPYRFQFFPREIKEAMQNGQTWGLY
jgi:hypothetical protein